MVQAVFKSVHVKVEEVIRVHRRHFYDMHGRNLWDLKLLIESFRSDHFFSLTSVCLSCDPHFSKSEVFDRREGSGFPAHFWGRIHFCRVARRVFVEVPLVGVVVLDQHCLLYGDLLLHERVLHLTIGLRGEVLDLKQFRSSQFHCGLERRSSRLVLSHNTDVEGFNLGKVASLHDRYQVRESFNFGLICQDLNLRLVVEEQLRENLELPGRQF